MSEETDRHSKALDVELIADPIARAEAEGQEWHKAVRCGRRTDRLLSVARQES